MSSTDPLKLWTGRTGENSTEQSRTIVVGLPHRLVEKESQGHPGTSAGDVAVATVAQLAERVHISENHGHGLEPLELLSGGDYRSPWAKIGRASCRERV